MIDQQGNIKLVDFGFAKYLKDKDRTYTNCGTPVYIAPEVIKEIGYGKQSDVWSFGVLLCEMITGISPFSDGNKDSIYEKILTC